ncbi:MAG: right-handed parallel beta-helix repeat-containing protein, partial [Clostridia bacterium]
GGVYVKNGTFTMEDGTISGNTAKTGDRIYLSSEYSIFNLNISPMSSSATIKGALYTNDADNFDMTVRTDNSNITIDGGSATSKSANDTVYFTGETWTFDPLEAETGGVKYTTLAAAVSNANDSGTVTLLKDVEISSAISIDKKITLDLNGFDIKQTTSGERVIYITSSGYLTLADTSTLSDRVRYGYWDVSSGNYVIVATATDVPTGTDSTELQGGVIYGGSASNGAGVYVSSSSTFAIKSGNIVGNKATSGGVYVNSGTFEMTGGTISDNEATDKGGGVYADGGTFTMENGTISGNEATSSNGGGVYVYNNSTFTMNNGTIEDNTATSGGGVYVTGSSSTFTMKDGTITNNEASSGGGVYVNSGTFEMTGGTVESNTATNGDRIYLAGVNAIFNLNISPMTSLATIKGALYTNDDDNFDMTVHTDGNVTIDNGTATSKSANDTVYFTGETWTFNPIEAKIGSTTYFTLENALAAANANDTITLLADVTLENQLEINKTLTIDLNGFDIKQTGSTRVISIDLGSNFTLVDSNPNSRTRYGYWDTTYKITDTYNADYTVLEGGIIYGGSSTMGAGVYVNSKDTFTMNGGNIAGNNADNNSGGGVYVDGGTFNMKGGSITGNSTSTYGSGGGVYVNGGTFTMKNGIITENKTKNGAGVYVDGGYFAMEDSTISKNIASYSYGGVCVYKSTFIMTSGTIEYNTASGSSGGGVGVNNSTFTMNGGTINNNTATTTDGGGVYVYYGTFIMNDGAINNNTATTNGGGVYNTSSTFTMNSGTIEYNTADYGGGVYISYENFLMNGGTITNNTATTNGGGVYVSSASSAKLSLQGEVIISGNTSNSNPDNVYLTNKKNIQLSGALIGSSLVGITSATTTAGTTVVSSDGYTLQTTDNEKFFYDDGSRAIILDTTTNVLKLATSLIDSMVTGIQDEEYTGSTLETTVIVTDGSVLTVDVDYEVSYSTETQAGDTVTVTITGIGNYGGTVTKTFTITKATLSASDFSFTAPSDLTYDGNEKSATVTNANIVGGGKITLTYTSSSPSYSSTTPPTDVGTYEVTVSVTGDNNYNDILSLADSWTFTIVPLEVSVEWTNTELYYTGSPQAPTATVSNKIKDDDVTIYVTDVGSHTAEASTLLGNDAGNYTLPTPLPTTTFTIDSTPKDFETYINGLDTKKLNSTLTFDDIRNVQTWYNNLTQDQRDAIDVYKATLKTGLDAYTDTIPANITVDVASGKDNIYIVGEKFNENDFDVIIKQEDDKYVYLNSGDATFTVPPSAVDGSGDLVRGTHTITVEYDELSTTIQIIVLEEFDIEGIIKDSDGNNPLGGADVDLFQKGEQIGSTQTTLSDGEFRFTGILEGIYNLVATYNNGTDTTIQTVLVFLDKNITTEVVMPEAGRNSHVDITVGTPVLAVGNVDKIASNITLAPGDEVAVTLDVYTTNPDTTIENEKLGNENLGLWLEISLEYELVSVGYAIGIDVASSLIEVVI